MAQVRKYARFASPEDIIMGYTPVGAEPPPTGHEPTHTRPSRERPAESPAQSPAQSPAERLDRLSQVLRSSRWFAQHHVSERRVRAAVDSGSLVRIARGWYVASETFESLYPEDRHLLTVLACAASTRASRPGTHETPPSVHPELLAQRAGRQEEPLSSTNSFPRTKFAPVFSHFSAAAALGLPLYRFTNDRVHTTLQPGTPRSSNSALVRRHVEQLNAEDVVSVGGFRCTSVARTVSDIARIASPGLALACADAGLRRLLPAAALSSRPPAAAELALLTTPLDQRPGCRGGSAARTLLALADHRAESPLESVSRLYLLELGFDLALQVPVPSPHGSTYRVDFELVGLGILGEVDGRSKYGASQRSQPGLHATGEDATTPQTESAIAQVHYREKRRHDWIEGKTGKRLIRWGAADLITPARFVSRLRAFGVTLPRTRY